MSTEDDRLPEPVPADGVHVPTTGIERVEPADVIRERVRYGDPPLQHDDDAPSEPLEFSTETYEIGHESRPLLHPLRWLAGRRLRRRLAAIHRATPMIREFQRELDRRLLGINDD